MKLLRFVNFQYYMFNNNFLSTMHNQQDCVNMFELLQLCSNLCLQSCTIVKDCYQNKDVKKFEKGFDDPVTEADFKVQTMLIRGIRKYFPNINIVGQQNVDYEGQINIKYDNMHDIKLPQAAKFNKEYKLKDVCLWIDPIDNTRGFIKGEANAVTVLIGISYQGASQVGIIGIPFKKQSNQFAFKPSVLIGCASSKFTFQYKSQLKQWVALKTPNTKPKQKPIIVMSPNRQNNIQKEVAQIINGEVVLAGGSGYKSSMIIKGEADIFTYCEGVTKKWDSCAGEAIIKSLNGFFIEGTSTNIQYDPKASSFANKNGLLCGFIQQYKQIVLQSIAKNKVSKL